MMPIRANAFVYFEFSVTVTGQQTPSLALGLAPPDCPLNVMVGSWPRSVGLYSDGQMLVGSRWFPDMSSRPSKIAAGTTVGILAYLRDPSMAVAEADAMDPEIFGALVAQAVRPRAAWSAGFGLLDVLSKALGRAEDDTAPPAATAAFATAATAARGSRDSIGGASSVAAASISSLDAYAPTAPGAPAADASGGRLHLRWNVNGQQSKFASDALDSVTDVISLKTPLYPTVSLLSADTRVWCRFCEADIVYRSRSTVGAPPGVRVYCLDGSLLLDEHDT